MAVIITDMDMPSRCDECSLITNGVCPLIGIDVEEEMGSRDMNCPLKSTDDMIAEIRQEHEKEWKLEDYDTAFGLSMAIDKIQKYCDKEQ